MNPRETREGAIRSLLLELHALLAKGRLPTVATRCVRDLGSLGIMYAQALEMANRTNLFDAVREDR